MGQNSDMGPEAAKALVRRYFQRLLNEKDLAACDEVLAGDYVDHDAPPGTPPGPQSVKEFVAGFLAEYPNLHVDILDIIAEGNKVAARLVWRGNRRESGAEFHQMGIIMLRLDDMGRLAERWSAYV